MIVHRAVDRNGQVRLIRTPLAPARKGHVRKTCAGDAAGREGSGICAIGGNATEDVEAEEAVATEADGDAFFFMAAKTAFSGGDWQAPIRGEK